MKSYDAIFRKMSKGQWLEFGPVARGLIGQLESMMVRGLVVTAETLGNRTGKLTRSLGGGNNLTVWSIAPTGPGMPRVRIARVWHDLEADDGVVQEFYLDSGFIAVGFFNPEIAQDDDGNWLIQSSSMWQNTRTLALYDHELDKRVCALLKPELTDVIQSGGNPLALEYLQEGECLTADSECENDLPGSNIRLWQKTRSFYATALYPGVHTGIGKYWVQCRAGRMLGEPERHLERSPLSNTFYANTYSQGLYREGPGKYWRVTLQVDADNILQLTAQKMKAPPRCLREAYAKAETDTDRIFIEGYMLAYTEEADTNVPVLYASASAFPLGRPFAYGFHFNWAGDKAVIVLHELTGSNDAAHSWTGWHCSYTSRVVDVEIDIDPVGLSASVQHTVSEISSWKFQNGEERIWLPVIDMFGSPIHCIKFADLSHEDDVQTTTRPSNTPIYAYYQASSSSSPVNDSKEVARYSHSVEVVPYPPDWVHTCESLIALPGDWTNVAGEMYTKDATRSGGNVYTFSLSFGGTTLSAVQAQTYDNEWYVYDFDVSMSEMGGTPPHAIGLAVWNELDGCSEQGKIQEDLYPAAFTRITRYETDYIFTGSWKSFSVSWFRSKLENGLAIVFPHNCAEGLSVKTQENKSGYGNQTYRQIVPRTVPNMRQLKEQVWKGFSDKGPEYEETVSLAGKYTARNGPSTTVTSQWLTQYRHQGAAYFFGRYGGYFHRDYIDETSATGTAWNDSPSAPFVYLDETTECVGAPVFIIQGIGREAYCTGNLGPATADGFPSELEDHNRVSIIGAV